MAVAFLLFTVLEEHEDREEKGGIDTCISRSAWGETTVPDHHLPTIAKAVVKIWSKTTLALELKGDMQPPFDAATAALVQTLSVTNGGEVLFS